MVYLITCPFRYITYTQPPPLTPGSQGTSSMIAVSVSLALSSSDIVVALVEFVVLALPYSLEPMEAKYL